MHQRVRSRDAVMALMNSRWLAWTIRSRADAKPLMRQRRSSELLIAHLLPPPCLFNTNGHDYIVWPVVRFAITRP